MKTKPIIFSAPMVRAILEGKKSQTRRILKQQPRFDAQGCHNATTGGRNDWWDYWSSARPDAQRFRAPYAAGDLLWVREAWADVNTECGPAWAYRADGGVVQPDFDGPDFGAGPSFSYDKYPGDYTMWVTDLFDGAPDHRWHSPIHMPRWASRLTLEVTAVRVQRVQDISEEDARAEGLTSITKDGKTWKWGVPDRDGLPGNDDHGWHWQEWDADPRHAYATLWNRLHGPGAWAKNPWCCAISFRTHHKNIDALLAERKAA